MSAIVALPPKPELLLPTPEGGANIDPNPADQALRPGAEKRTRLGAWRCRPANPGLSDR